MIRNAILQALWDEVRGYYDDSISFVCDWCRQWFEGHNVICHKTRHFQIIFKYEMCDSFEIFHKQVLL